MIKEIWWRALEGIAYAAKPIAAVLALAAVVLMLTCTFVGAVAISDNYWSFTW